MRNFLTIMTALVLSLRLLSPSQAEACPMCKAATEQDDKQPKAYMYSILFMLGMPTIIFGTFGYGLYKLNKRESEMEPLAPLDETVEE